LREEEREKIETNVFSQRKSLERYSRAKRGRKIGPAPAIESSERTKGKGALPRQKYKGGGKVKRERGS